MLQGASGPGSVNEPRSKPYEAPTLAGPLRCAVGGTLWIVTDWVSVLPASLSESVACTETIELASPSAKVQPKLPELFVFASENATLVPLAPQLVVTDWTVS